MDYIKLLVVFRDSVDTEFVRNLIKEVSSLVGYKSHNGADDKHYEFEVSPSSSAHYVLKRWQDRGLLTIE